MALSLTVPDNFGIDLLTTDQKAFFQAIIDAVDALEAGSVSNITVDVTLATGADLILASAGAGTKIGTAADQLLAFHGATPVDQAALVADAEVAHDLNSTFSDTEAEAALDALGGKINAILDVLIEKGLMAAE